MSKKPIVKLKNELYYITFDGHEKDHIEFIRNKLLEKGKNKFVYLSGESLFDNKRHVKTKKETIYKNIFQKEENINDIENQLNDKLLYDYVSLNCSYSNSSITDRNKRVYENDNFIGNNITEDDFLVISLNGADFLEKTNHDIISKISYVLEKPPDENSKDLLFICDYYLIELKKYINHLTYFKYPEKIFIYCFLYPSSNEDKELDTIFNMNGYKKRSKRFKKMLENIFNFLNSKLSCPKIKFIKVNEIINHEDNSLYSGKLRLNEKGGDLLTTNIVNEIFAF